jgi:hypothetical protein
MQSLWPKLKQLQLYSTVLLHFLAAHTNRLLRHGHFYFLCLGLTLSLVVVVCCIYALLGCHNNLCLLCVHLDAVYQSLLEVVHSTGATLVFVAWAWHPCACRLLHSVHRCQRRLVAACACCHL